MGTIINHLIHPDQYQNYKPKKSLLCPLLAEVAHYLIIGKAMGAYTNKEYT
jgi:hypothetical protein